LSDADVCGILIIVVVKSAAGTSVFQAETAAMRMCILPLPILVAEVRA